MRSASTSASHVPFEQLTDDEWGGVSYLLKRDDRRRFGRPRRDPRDLLNAILWVLTQGERWHHIPLSMPPAQTCYIKYLQWKRDGTLEKVFAELESRSPDNALQLGKETTKEAATGA
jgi:transposase